MRHKNYALCTRVAWAIAILGIGASALAQTFLPRTDGWYAWSIDAVEGAPHRCCFVWDDDLAKAGVCDLDAPGSGYGSSDEWPATNGSARVYAQVRDGEVSRVHAFSASCRVTTRTPVVAIKDVTPMQSLALLEEALRAGDAKSHEAVGAIAMHAGVAAGRTLVRLADPRENMDVRKAAVFYMGQLRSADTGDDLTRIMFDDLDPSLREHAAFSMSESALSNREALLVRLANQDTEPGVRGKAWFWLAQTESTQTESAIFEWLGREKSTKARHEAIFALAQLPDERAARALIRVVETKERALSDRKQALFWLAQGESDAGLDYLSRVLSTAGK